LKNIKMNKAELLDIALKNWSINQRS